MKKILYVDTKMEESSSPTPEVCPSHPHWSLHRWTGSSSVVQEEAWCCAAAWCCATHAGGGRYPLPDGCMYLRGENDNHIKTFWKRVSNGQKNMNYVQFLVKDHNEYVFRRKQPCASFTWELTLAAVACIQPGAVPGLHGGVHAGYSCGVKFW